MGCVGCVAPSAPAAAPGLRGPHPHPECRRPEPGGRRGADPPVSGDIGGGTSPFSLHPLSAAPHFRVCSAVSGVGWPDGLREDDSGATVHHRRPRAGPPPRDRGHTTSIVFFGSLRASGWRLVSSRHWGDWGQGNLLTLLRTLGYRSPIICPTPLREISHSNFVHSTSVVVTDVGAFYVEFPPLLSGELFKAGLLLTSLQETSWPAYLTKSRTPNHRRA